MLLKWYGHSCFSMTFANGTTLITDPFDASMKYPLCTARADVALVSASGISAIWATCRTRRSSRRFRISI